MEDLQALLREAKQLENPAAAEIRYRRALALCEARGETAQARDLCLTLADLAMQQGNMHGADVWYVRAMNFS